MSHGVVDPFTVAVGQAIAAKFQMSTLNIHRMGEAIKNLRCVPSIDKTLWFGFGINHIVRSMTHTTEGSTCLMLCSALSETRSMILSARVMYELTVTYSSSSPEAARLTPSLQQWESLVKVSADCLTATPFETVVDQLVNLIHPRQNVSLKGDHRHLVENPQDVAKVLNALGKLSLGQITTLTVSEDDDCD